jgi:hypothetical protein
LATLGLVACRAGLIEVFLARTLIVLCAASLPPLSPSPNAMGLCGLSKGMPDPAYHPPALRPLKRRAFAADTLPYIRR